METDGLVPSAVIRGTVRVPGSKSIAQRALAAAAMAHGTTQLVGLPSSDDVVHALRCARAVGARFPSSERPDDLFVTALLRRRGHGRLTGAPPAEGAGARPWCTATAGESGTAARLFTALLALSRPSGSGAEVLPKGTLERRRSPALFAALRAVGVGIEHAIGSEDGWPVLLTAAEAPERMSLAAPTSSQEVSALILALAADGARHRLEVHGAIPSAPYVDLTVALLSRFGVRVERERSIGADGAPVERFDVQGPLSAPEEPLEIEPDASAAAVALAAGCLSGGEATVEGLGEGCVQPDLALLDVLGAFGCCAEVRGHRITAHGRPSRGATLDLAACPDLAPVAAALAASAALHAGAGSRLAGLATLPGKESSRIEVLARGLAAFGLAVEAGDDFLSIEPGRAGEERVVLDPEGDHRMAFAFALLGLVRDGVAVASPRCVAKSWPGFWTDLRRATLPPR